MKKHVLDIYLCGERDPGSMTIPRHYEYFFNKKWMFIVLFSLFVMLLVATGGMI